MKSFFKLSKQTKIASFRPSIHRRRITVSDPYQRINNSSKPRNWNSETTQHNIKSMYIKVHKMDGPTSRINNSKLCTTIKEYDLINMHLFAGPSAKIYNKKRNKKEGQ